MDNDIKLSEARAQLRNLESNISHALSEFYRSTGVAPVDISISTIKTIGGDVVFHISIEANL